MNIIRFLYFAPIVEVAKSSADADDVSLLAQRLFEPKHIPRGSGSNDEKETEKKRPKRMIEAGAKRLLQLISYNHNEYGEIFTASDGCVQDNFGASCSVSEELVVVGAPWFDEDKGAAYLFHLDGTEVAKLTPGDDGKDYDQFGGSVSIDEKIVVGSDYGDYVRVFSRDGIYEKTLTYYNCTDFGTAVATHGNLIVTRGYDYQNSINKLFIYSTEGLLLNELEQDWIGNIAISEQFIISTATWFDGGGKTIIHSNTSPDYPEIAEINQGGDAVAVSNDRLVIGDGYANNNDGAAWLYKTDGTLVKTLDRQDAWSRSEFGHSVAITDDKVLVGAAYDNNSQGYRSGSVFIYSAVTGEFIKKVLAPDARCTNHFGSSVCASDSHYVVGAPSIDWNTGAGAAYLFNIPP